MPINKNNKDLLLIFDLGISEKVEEWAGENSDTLEEAISRLELFSLTKKTGKGSKPYFLLISTIILCSRDPERAGEVALQTLKDERKKNKEKETE